MHKTILPFILAVCILTAVIPSAGAVKLKPNVTVNGIDADPAGAAFAENGTAYVPLRCICEALGATVSIWDPNTAAAEFGCDGIYIKAVLGEKYITANGRYIYIPGGVSARAGYIMVPARAAARAFGVDVRWEQETGSVIFSGEPQHIEPAEEHYDSTDLYWLSRIIHAEARGESLEGKIAVGNVVLNRVKAQNFPNSVKAVIFDRKFGVQFTPAYSGAIYNTPSAESVIAAKLALEGTDIAGESLYFATSQAAVSCWAGKNRPVIARIDNQVFFA